MSRALPAWWSGVGGGLAVVAAGFAAAPRLAGQGTAEQLSRAHTLYESLDIERALPLLRQVLSPSWPFEVTAAQRVDAYKYLGASLAIAGKPDSAVVYFRAALERDPFTDLDPATFTPQQLTLFNEARQRTFAVGIRSLTAARVDPRRERLAFTIVTTHRALVEVMLRPLGGGASAAQPFVLYEGESDRLREIDWNVLLADGRLAPPGRYELALVAQSARLATADSASAYFDLTHEVEPLEDTLPPIGPQELLPEQRPASAASGELLKGLAVALAATAISEGLPNDGLGGGMRLGGRTVAAVGLATGVVSFFYHRRHRELPANIASNALRRGARAAANAQIRSRNEERMARTVIVIAPAAGNGP